MTNEYLNNFYYVACVFKKYIYAAYVTQLIQIYECGSFNVECTYKSCFHIYELSKGVSVFYWGALLFHCRMQVTLQNNSYFLEKRWTIVFLVDAIFFIPHVWFTVDFSIIKIPDRVVHIPLLCMVFHAALCNTGNTGPGLLYKTDWIIGKCLWNCCSTPCCWKCIFRSQFR